MADEAEVEVQEEGVVEINLDGSEAKKAAEPKAEQKTEPKTEQKTQPTAKAETALPGAEATKALQEAIDNEKKLRQAAEQTALTERQRADQEAMRRQAREQELQQAHQGIADREQQMIETGISNATKEIAATQKELTAALSEGNFEKAAEAQTRLSRASAALDRWEDKKTNYDSATQTRVASEGAVTEQPASVQSSPFERYISGMQPAAQSWLRAHPECAPTDVGGRQDMNSKMMRGHYDALAQGYSPNSDNYFRVIEESTGFRKAPATEQAATGEEVEAPKPPKRQAQPSAPPSREPPGSTQTGSTRTVRLTKEEQEAARFSFPNLEPAKAFAEYAKNKVALDAEGKLGRTSH